MGICVFMHFPSACLFLALSGVRQGRCGAGGGTKGERGEKEVDGGENRGNEQGFEGFRKAFGEVIGGRMVWNDYSGGYREAF